MSPPPATAIEPLRPELVTDEIGKRKRAGWVELATSADHKDNGRVLIAAAFGFLFVALIEFLLMRLQLAVPENSFLRPVTFNRLLSLYGATGVFLFLMPLVMGLFYYVVPLQIGARSTALPRLGQLGFWLFIFGALTLNATFLYTPPEGGVNPLPPLSELSFIANDGIDAWLSGVALVITGLLFVAINLVTTMRTMRAPGMAWRRMPIFAWAGAVSSWLLIFISPLMLGVITMLFIDRNSGGVFFDAAGGGAPLLWQHLSWIFYTGIYMIVAIFALGTAGEIIPAFSRQPLFNRSAVRASLVAIAVLGTLAWMQNMYSTPISIGFDYFAMLMAMAVAVPFGLVFFNLISTMAGGTIRMRAPMLYILGALATAAVGLGSELGHSIVGAGWKLHGTVDSTAATHYALIGSGVFGGFAALAFWFPKICGRTMGESMAKISFWTMMVGMNVTFLPMFMAGVQGQVADAYKYFDGTGLAGYNLISTIGAFILAAGIIVGIANAVLSLENGPRAAADPWGGSSLEWFATSPPPVHNFDVLPDVRSAEPLRDIRKVIAERSQGTSEPSEKPQPVA